MTMLIPRPDFDKTKAEVFAERLIGALNDAALTLMISIGHRTGLFDTLVLLPPATSATIAQKADLSERYVREWLAVMVVSGVVDYDPQNQVLSLAHRARDLSDPRGQPR